MRKIDHSKIIALIILIIFSSVQISAQNSNKTFVAKKGDGIYSVLRENNIPTSHFKEFVELNKSKLGKNNSLYVGVTYQLPASSTVNSSGVTRSYEIFGGKYKDVEITDNKLKGTVYYLVSGHGGPDPGATSNYNGKLLCEDEYAYDVTLRLARNLISHGALVYLIIRDPHDGIRDGVILDWDHDEYCYPNLTIPRNPNLRLRQRKDAVNKLYSKHKGQYQRLVVVHVDSRSKRENIDLFFYYDKRSNSGKKLANNLRNVIDKKYAIHQPGRGYGGTISSRNLYMLKYTWPVATFIELGNIQHHRDLKRVIVDDNRQAIANWLDEGLLLDYQNNRD